MALLLHHPTPQRRRKARVVAFMVGLLALATAPSLGDAAPALDKTLTIQSLGLSVRYPDGWSEGTQILTNVWQLVNVPADQQGIVSPSAWINIGGTPRVDHADAVAQLKDISRESAAPSTFLSVGGWPALQRRSLEARPQPSKGSAFADERVLRITTAVAAGSLLVRVEAELPSNADPLLIEQAEAIGQSLTFGAAGNPTQTLQELEILRRTDGSSFTPAPAAGSSLSLTASVDSEARGASLTQELTEDVPGLISRVISAGNGEVEVVASPNGQIIVIAQQANIRTSQNGGQTFPFINGLPTNNFGDTSLAYGLSGNIYLGYINQTAGCRDANGNGCATGIARSTDNGQTFPFLANAVQCPLGTSPPGCFPDQEHIGADRANAGTGGDQVYSVWRNFAPGPNASIICSQDSGVNWTAPAAVDAGGGDFPRIAVAQDGFVYVVYRQGGNIRINKYSSCRNGLTVQATFPKTVVGVTDVTCPVPGLDRCNTGNLLSSHIVAVDDTNPNHVFVAYATNTVAGSNEDVIVRDSVDAAVTWPAARSARVNTAIPARRFMPWLCATGGEAFATWYDRRAATPCPTPPCPNTNNDLTDFFGGSAALDLAGNLVAGAEFKITTVPDPQCASGWPCLPRSTQDSESCSIQPQNAGICCNGAINNTTGACPAGSSNARCDFNPDSCTAPETCQTSTQAGCPKYGDYNGNACAAGRLLAAWASATPPPGTAASGGIDTFFSALLVGSVGQIQVPGSVTVPDTCVGSTSSATLDVCNTGNTNLAVNSISSSNPLFAVTTPTSGYPVVISPDFCFPFQVGFTPTAPGAQSTTLTIASDDPARPSITVAATASGLQPQIATFIANAGSFGDVCRDVFKDLELTISNSGGCNLVVNNIVSSAGEFLTAGTSSFPLTILPGTSMQVPIRLQPTSLGAKAANLTISSNDPVTPSKVVAVSGNTPPGDIRVTGSTDFGDVCAGAMAEKTVNVHNVGKCNLNVASAAFVPPCSDFTLINNPFPAAVSPDSGVDLTIRFTPTSAGPKSCTLVIASDDPETPSVSLPVTANTPAAAIDVAADQSFLPEVIQSAGVCSSLKPFPVSNTGTCNLKITNVAIGGANASDFGLSGLPSFPIILEPGHLAGEGDLKTVFAPTAIDRDRLGTVTVRYVSDPVTGATTDVTRNVCGEGVLTGARVLVRVAGKPVTSVERIHLQRTSGNKNKNQVDTVDVAKDLLLQAITPGGSCAPFSFHREYGTVSNPVQLLPGSYLVTATALVNGKRQNKTVGFDVQTCDFNPTVIVDF
jgi:hypothetical protein